jgi:hypothetical protein
MTEDQPSAGADAAQHIAAALVGKSMEDAVNILAATILTVMEQTDARGRGLIWNLISARVLYGITIIETRATHGPVGHA